MNSDEGLARCARDGGTDCREVTEGEPAREGTGERRWSLDLDLAVAQGAGETLVAEPDSMQHDRVGTDQEVDVEAGGSQQTDGPPGSRTSQ